MKPFRMIYFLEVILGALIGLNFNYSLLNLISITIVFISFQLLYSSIYILNDLIDYKKDRKDPVKPKRIIASGLIKRKNAFAFSLILILISLFIAMAYSAILLGFEIFFLSFNLIYSFILKKIPYADSFSNGVTHPMRFALGMVLFNGIFNFYIILSIFILSSGLSFLKRFRELKQENFGRSSLHYYNSSWLIYILILLGIILGLISFVSMNVFVLSLFLFYILLLICYFMNKGFRNWFNRILTY